MSTGSVYRRETPAGSSSWVAHVAWYEGGKRRQLKRAFRTKREAQAALIELMAAHQTGRFVEPSKTKLRDYAEVWLDGLISQGRKATTLRGYRANLNNYVLPALGDVALQDLKAADLDKLYADMVRNGGSSGRPLSLATVHHAHAVVNKMLNDAERKGLVLRNVARLATAPSLSTARSKAPEMTVWTPEELRAFLQSIRGNRNEPMFRLMAMTGIRRGEAVGLRWRDIDVGRRQVSIVQAVSVVDDEELVDVPKSRRSRRTLDIDPETMRLLEGHRARQGSTLSRVDLAEPEGDRVFTNDVGQPLRPHSVGQAFTRLVTKAGLPMIRLHDLRHTHASHLLSAGVNIKVVSERLGHASVSFTLDTYGHVMPGQQAEAAAAAAALVHWEDEVS